MTTIQQRRNPQNADPNFWHPRTTTSYSIRRDLHIRWIKRLPKCGTRSKVIAKLIEMFLEGKVVVTVNNKSV